MKLWVCHVTQRSKQLNVRWRPRSPTKKISKQHAAHKIMCALVFWDKQGILLLSSAYQRVETSMRVRCCMKHYETVGTDSKQHLRNAQSKALCCFINVSSPFCWCPSNLFNKSGCGDSITSA
ncbi:hypothetical protein AVEN_13545-1 [Araneus ventricosus]|uniref:Uncharacterized protein n=1 Tax=Araneus ventricosus TaxID=182803 RepID=A0A4Y2D4T0_ARAVE|nr:hypothetical protein AVEN_13545-1 [Araneus ventricosus]